VDVEDMFRLEVAADHPSEAVATLHHAAHTFLQAQPSELHQLLVMIRMHPSILTRFPVRLLRWAQSVAMVGESYGNRIRHPVMSANNSAAIEIPIITTIVRGGTLTEIAT
jgi:hypothetical protein